MVAGHRGISESKDLMGSDYKINLMIETDEKCSVCDYDMEFTGYDGDWAIIECLNDECSHHIFRPVSNPSSDGFTMESLGHIADYKSGSDE